VGIWNKRSSKEEKTAWREWFKERTGNKKGNGKD
jgi:hypothetical protein